MECAHLRVTITDGSVILRSEPRRAIARRLASLEGWVSRSRALDLLAQHFKFQPAILGLLQFGLRFRQPDRELVKGRSILCIKVGVVKALLLLCDVVLKFCHGLG